MAPAFSVWINIAAAARLRFSFYFVQRLHVISSLLMFNAENVM